MLGTADINGTGTAGNNTILGNAGTNTLIGGAGDDTYGVDNATDVVSELASGGTDTVNSTAASYTLGDNLQNLILTGTADINGTGNALSNTIVATAGNNTLDGGVGADRLIGGAGNDIYIVDNEAEASIERADEGHDTVLSTIDHTLSDNVEDLTLTGVSDINGTGNVLGNTLTGNSGANTLNGGAGDDTINGGAGDDTAVIAGTLAAATITRSGDTTTITSADGVDAVSYTHLTLPTIYSV